MSSDLVDFLTGQATPSRPAVAMSTVRILTVSPLVIDERGASLDGAVRVLDSYTPAPGDLAVMIRAGGLAVLIGKVT